MEDFRVAGSTMDDEEERLLSQVVRIAGYASTIRQLVDKSFTFCRVHKTFVPKADRRRGHLACQITVPTPTTARPRDGPPRTRP